MALGRLEKRYYCYNGTTERLLWLVQVTKLEALQSLPPLHFPPTVSGQRNTKVRHEIFGHSEVLECLNCLDCYGLRLNLCNTSSNVQKFCVLFAKLLCVLCGSQNKQGLFLYTA